MPPVLDDLDRRLLRVLQADNRLSMAELAERVNSSAPTCLRRVKRLREEGVIVGDVCLIDPAAVGRRMTMIAQVTVERERPDLIDLFKKSVVECEEVSACYYVTGDVDFVLILHVTDMEEYERLIERLFHSNSNVKQFKTLTSIRRVKFSTNLPV